MTQERPEYEGTMFGNGGSQTPGQGYNANDIDSNSVRSGSSVGANMVVIPTVKETALISDLDDNWDQTQAFIKQFEDDRANLSQTYGDCEDLVKTKFESLRDLLDQRENILMQQLKKKYEDRDDKLGNQIDDLKDHKNRNETVRAECIEHIRTMTAREQRGERYKKIKEAIDTCIHKSSPKIQQVPIELKYIFKTENDLKKLIEDYGKLSFRRIESGKDLKFTVLNTDIVTNKGNVGSARRPQNRPANSKPVPQLDDDNKEKDIILPILDRFAMKFDRKSEQLSCEIKIKDPSEMKENEKDNYNNSKEFNVFLHIECVGNNEKKMDDWDSGDLHLNDHLLLSKMKFDGKKYSMALPSNDNYEPGMVIHGRGRLVYLESEDDTDNVLKASDWSKENSAKFGKANIAAGGQQEEEEQEIVVDNGPIVSIDDLPEKVKFKCKLIVNGVEKDKPLSLTKSKEEFNYNSLIERLRKVPMVKKTDPNANFNIVLTNADGQKITNDNELINHCLAKSIGVEKNDLKDTLGMKATME